MRTPSIRRTALGILFALLLVTSASVWSGCVRSSPTGPAFAAAPEPTPGRARLYLFRIDPQPSLSRVEIGLDGSRRRLLGHGEYITLELDPGPHRLDFRQRGLAFASFGWNQQQLLAKSGETIYVEVSVRISAQPMPGGSPDLEIAGRSGGSASENVFVQRRSRDDAIRILADTTLHIE